MGDTRKGGLMGKDRKGVWEVDKNKCYIVTTIWNDDYDMFDTDMEHTI